MEVSVHVIEGELAVVVVKVDTHFPRYEILRQGGERHRQRFELRAPLQPQGQVARVSVQGFEAFSQGRFFGYTQPPVSLPNLHLPVVAAGFIALHSDSAPPAVKALVVVGDIFPLKATAQPLLIHGDEQVRVGCVQVQAHLH